MSDPNLLPTETRRFRLDGLTLFLAGAVLLANGGLALQSARLDRQVTAEKAALERSDAEIRQLESSLPRLDDLKSEVTRLGEQARASRGSGRTPSATRSSWPRWPGCCRGTPGCPAWPSSPPRGRSC